MTSLGISLGAVFVVTLVLSGFDLKAAVVTIGTIVMILVNLGGFMAYTGVTLNAIRYDHLLNFLTYFIFLEFSCICLRGKLPYSNRISPWLTEFGPLPWQAKQTVADFIYFAANTDNAVNSVLIIS